MTLPLTQAETEFIIPQKHPFVLITTLEAADEKGCTTSFTIPANHVLVDNNQLQPSGLMENIAQSCAAMMGYVTAQQMQAAKEGELPKPKVGFIGDVRDFNCTALPQAGSTIRTEVSIDNQIFDVTMISGKIFQNETEIASCKMKIFVKAEEPKG